MYQRLFPNPVTWVEEWQWARPYAAILQFAGFTVDHLVNDPRAAAQMRTLWCIWKASRKLAEKREREMAALEVLWWRSLDCPVPCILCGRLERCACGEREPYASQLGKTGTGRLGLGRTWALS